MLYFLIHFSRPITDGRDAPRTPHEHELPAGTPREAGDAVGQGHEAVPGHGRHRRAGPVDACQFCDRPSDEDERPTGRVRLY